MPITIGTYKCLVCKGEFEATSEEFRECGCGESVIKLDNEGMGFTYKDNRYVDEVSSVTYYSKDEFLPMTDKMNSLIEEIKEIHSRVPHFYLLSFTYQQDFDGNEYLDNLYLSYDKWIDRYNMERNILEVWILFTSGYRNTVEGVEAQLEKLAKLMSLISSGEVDFSDRKKLFELAEVLDLDYRKEKQEIYDYRFTL